MEYNSIISAIPKEWKRYMLTFNDSPGPVMVLSDKYNWITLMSRKLVSKNVYAELIKHKATSVNLQEKWSMYIINDENITNVCLTHIYSLTIDNILRSFQFRLLHRIIYFNDKLKLFKLSDSEICDFCNMCKDSIEHRMWLCPKTKILWKNILQWYNQQFNTNVSLTYQNIITNVCHNPLLDFVILCTKYHIYKSFTQQKNLHVQTLIDEILFLEKVENEIAYKKGKINFHMLKWGNLSSV
jgi:hypothetical protein